MKKIVFMLTLLAPAAFCGKGSDALEKTITALKAAGQAATLQNILGNKYFTSLSLDPKYVDKILQMVSDFDKKGSLKKTVQAKLCRKGNAWDGTFSLRSFYGAGCVYPAFGQYAQILCQGYEDFDQSDCNKIANIIKRERVIDDVAWG